MPISVYPSLLPGAPIETHDYPGGTIGAWLDSQGLDWRNRDPQPVMAFVNGTQLPAAEWDTSAIRAKDVVELRIVPNGGIISAIGSIISGVLKFAFGWLMPGSSTPNFQSQQGQQLETSEAKANTAKLGQVVPELAGRFKRYPDYLTPPRRYFVSPREQRLEFLCCVGPGRYQINPDEVFVGDTPFSSMGGNAEYAIFQPGDDVSWHSAHEHWYTTSEVGVTSGGSAGLELSAEFSPDVNPPAGAYTFDGNTVSLNPADGIFPTSWGAGTALDLAVPQSYNVTQEFDTVSESYFNRFNGNFRELGASVMMELEVTFTPLPAQPYFIRAMNLDANGVGWIELQDQFGVVVSTVPAGTYTMTFRKPGRSYRVVSRSDNQIVIEAIYAGNVESGWPGFPNVTRTDATITVDPDTVYGEWTSLFRACPAGEVTTTFELDFFFQSGLARVNDNGSLSNQSVSVEIQYRDANGPGPWTSVIKTYTDRTLDQIGFTERFDVPAMRPEVQVRRVGSKNTSTSVQDTINWYALRSRLGTRSSYPNWTTMAVRIVGAGKIAAQSENQVNVIATRILPTLQPNGTWGAEQPTRDISAFAKYIGTTIGYTDANFDMDELLRLHNVWASRGETLDYVYDETTVKDALMLTFNAGMGEFSVDDGRIRPVRDDVRTTFEQAYSPQNMTGPLAKVFRAKRVDDADGVQVEYTDSDTWTQQTIDCLLPGDMGFKLEKLQLRGVTDRTRAWRIGMRRRRALRYRNWEYSFETELDALNSGYMSYVALVDDVPGYGKSSILTSVQRLSPTEVALMVTEPLEWENGETHIVAYRAPDGSLVGPFMASQGPDDYTVIGDIPDPLPTVTLTREPTHVYFGTVARWTYPALVTEVTPQGMESVSVSAANYDVRVYADDNNAPA